MVCSRKLLSIVSIIRLTLEVPRVQHGVARTKRIRTEQQRQQDLDKIQKYRSLEDQFRKRVCSSPDSRPCPP